ncbi:aldo/keto reductase [Silvibacterium sp.]|uniref:aldo/keto reductase n=1 Tax=Silvibacterium sp. TaxID=1964179 RepID=UPI0039E67505
MKPTEPLPDAVRSNRRTFLKTGASIAAGLSASAALADTRPGNADPLRADEPVQGLMPTRNLGRTGARVAIFGLGGQGALEKINNEAVAVPIIQRALELGVNYFDTSAIYGGPDRWSEQYLGKGLKGSREKVFLATKTKERTRDAALKNIELSLKLLNTDYVDSWQLHDVGIQEDVDQIFGKGGALEALIEAREQKIVRNLGVTGRFRPEALMECIRRFPFDTVLFGVNAADRYHYPFAKDLLPLAVEKQMGVIGMKVMARGRILSSWTPPPIEEQKRSWEGTGAIATTPGTLSKRETFFYNLSLPLSTAIIGCDSVAQVEECAELARAFTPLSQAQMATLEAKVEPVAKQALFFRLMPR